MFVSIYEAKEALVERRQHGEADERHRGEDHDHLLNRLLLRPRAAAHAPCEKDRVSAHQIERDRNRRTEIDREVKPGLPPVDGAGAAEQQHRHDGEQGYEPDDGLPGQASSSLLL